MFTFLCILWQMGLMKLNLEEFTSIKNKLIDFVIDFEQTERRIFFLNNAYLLNFHEELEQQRYLQYENEYLIKAIAMDVDGKTEEEVKTFLEGCRKEFEAHIHHFQRQYQTALEYEKQIVNYVKEDIEQNDQEFISYCSIHHPLVKAYSTELERTIYSSLSMLYRTGNITGFKNVMKECSGSFTSPEISSDDYEKIAQLYQETIEHLNSIKQQRDTIFPLNKADIFNKEELITRELMDLREKNYQDREMNKSIQADFKLHFSFEFSL